jgi:hypothetical protein
MLWNSPQCSNSSNGSSPASTAAETTSPTTEEQSTTEEGDPETEVGLEDFGETGNASEPIDISEEYDLALTVDFEEEDSPPSLNQQKPTGDKQSKKSKRKGSKDGKDRKGGSKGRKDGKDSKGGSKKSKKWRAKLKEKKRKKRWENKKLKKYKKNKFAKRCDDPNDKDSGMCCVPKKRRPKSCKRICKDRQPDGRRPPGCYRPRRPCEIKNIPCKKSKRVFGFDTSKVVVERNSVLVGNGSDETLMLVPWYKSGTTYNDSIGFDISVDDSDVDGDSSYSLDLKPKAPCGLKGLEFSITILPGAAHDAKGRNTKAPGKPLYMLWNSQECGSSSSTTTTTEQIGLLGSVHTSEVFSDVREPFVADAPSEPQYEASWW